jgi:hypothetical protein
MVEILRTPNTRVEFDPRTESEKNRNILIKNALGSILAINKRKVDTINYTSVLFNDPKNPLYEIVISLGDNTPNGFNRILPDGFDSPAYAYGDGDYRIKSALFCKKYDVIWPNYVVGPADIVYFLKKIYFFNDKGQAFKYEFPHPAWGVLTNKAKENSPKIDFIPSDNDIQYSRLNIMDYANIREGLTKIKHCKVQTV